MRRLTNALYVLAALTIAAAPAAAHETDHYTLPAGRQTADLEKYFTHWAYDALESAVEQANADARAAIERGDEQRLQEIGTQDYIFEVTWQQFPAAYFVIEGLEDMTEASDNGDKYPGYILGHKELMGGVYTGAYLPIDPRQLFRVWHASVVQAYGVYFGTDKVGHFTDMGKNYYNAYRKALRNGASEAEAIEAATELGTDHAIYSENALLGFWTAGAYSNGDLAANYSGFLFYRNLAEPIRIDGEELPPLLEWDGQQWSLASHVRRDSHFMARFVSDHWDEALNPSVYERSMRDGLRRNMVERAPAVLWRYRDENDNPRLPTYFVERAVELSRIGEHDYGHHGSLEEILTLAEAYEPFDADAPLDARNQRGHTPLHDAVAWGDIGRTETLLDRGADPNAKITPSEIWSADAGCTPLHLAARTGRPEMVRLLLEHGAKVHARDADGATVAHHAAGHAPVMALLLEAGAEAHARAQDGRTVLHWAAAKDDDPSIRLLLESGARANVADGSGRTPLHVAAKLGSAATVAALSEHADIEAADGLGLRPLHLAAARWDRAAEDVVRVLLVSGADPNAEDTRGRTAMHEAARCGREGSLALMGDNGGEIDSADAWGTTPLHLASRAGREHVVAWLIEHGAPVNVANAAGVRPLHEAAFAGLAPLARQLVEAGADPGVRDARNRTPAAIARAEGANAVAELLQERASQLRLAGSE